MSRNLFNLRSFAFHPVTILSVSIGIVCIFIFAYALRHGFHSVYNLYYVAPIGVPFVAFLFDRAERASELSKKQIYIDSIIVVASLLRAEVPVPFYSGHALFLTFAILTTRSWAARITAAAVMVQVAYLKVFVWGDLSFFGGVLIGTIAAFIFNKATNDIPDSK